MKIDLFTKHQEGVKDITIVSLPTPIYLCYIRGHWSHKLSNEEIIFCLTRVWWFVQTKE